MRPPRVAIAVQTVGLADWVSLPNPHSCRYCGTNPGFDFLLVSLTWFKPRERLSLANRWMCQYPWGKNTDVSRGTNRGESNVYQLGLDRGVRYNHWVQPRGVRYKHWVQPRAVTTRVVIRGRPATSRTLRRVSVLRPAPSSCRNSMTARTLRRVSVLWSTASSCRHRWFKPWAAASSCRHRWLKPVVVP